MSGPRQGVTFRDILQCSWGDQATEAEAPLLRLVTGQSLQKKWRGDTLQGGPGRAPGYFFVFMGKTQSQHLFFFFLRGVGSKNKNIN